jgi:hypothetical protein
MIIIAHIGVPTFTIFPSIFANKENVGASRPLVPVKKDGSNQIARRDHGMPFPKDTLSTAERSCHLEANEGDASPSKHKQAGFACYYVSPVTCVSQ